MKLLRFLFCFVPLAAFAQAPTPSTPADASENTHGTATLRDPLLPTLFIAGDSTAAKSNSAVQQGWAEPFADFFDPAKVNIVNRARGGRSSRTFITEGLWDKMLAEVKAGDFVLIQFGHNDASPVNEDESVPREKMRSRGSLPGLGEETREIDNVITGKHEVIHTFGWYVRKMIAEVKARDATPVVLSLTVRNLWKDGKIERGSGSYRAWDHELAKTAGISYVDVTRLIADEYQSIGEEKVKAFFPQDYVHTGPRGAELNAALVTSGLKGLRESPFTALLSPKGAAVESDKIGWLNLPEPANPELPSIVLIGDSTVRNGGGNGSNGEWGWGDSLGNFFDPAKINIVNRAVGGLSSRTFLTEGHWQRALPLIKAGDFVLMQFGHNDGGSINAEPPDSKRPLRARASLPGLGEESEEIDNVLTKKHEVVHTYGWYLRQFIRDAKAAGATPIVCSLVPRKTWKDGKILRPSDSYVRWAREVAEQEQVSFIDLSELIATRYESLGEEKVEPLFADANTHTSKAGADLNAEVVANALRALPAAPSTLTNASTLKDSR